MRPRTGWLAEAGRGLLGLVYLGGAAVHVYLWATNRAVYGEMTQFVLFDWYRELWTGFVLPNLWVLLPALAAFELLVGVAILRERPWARAGLAAGAAFNVAVAPLGFWWPANAALALVHVALLRYGYPRGVLGSLRGRFEGRPEAR